MKEIIGKAALLMGMSMVIIGTSPEPVLFHGQTSAGGTGKLPGSVG